MIIIIITIIINNYYNNNYKSINYNYKNSMIIIIRLLKLAKTGDGEETRKSEGYMYISAPILKTSYPCDQKLLVMVNKHEIFRDTFLLLF